VSCTPSEGEQQYPLGRHPTIDEVRHAINERARLAAAGSSDDQQWAVAMRCGRELVRVQLRREISAGGGRRHDALAQWDNSADIIRHTRNIPEGDDVTGARNWYAFPTTLFDAPDWWSRVGRGFFRAWPI
jgi:hypothetical protein